LTPEEVWRFSQAGIGEVFPYSVLIPAPDAGGRVVEQVSARRSVGEAAVHRYRRGAAAGPRVRFDPLVASVHVISPVASNSDTVGDWRTGIAAIRVALNDFADAAGQAAVIIAGDFNSTLDMRQYRDLLTNR
jgi:hypothetical protein